MILSNGDRFWYKDGNYIEVVTYRL
jgi:hypothetical protein